MSVNSVPNKYEIFQIFYFKENNKWLSITDAMQYYYDLDDKNRAKFENFYEEETGYEIISPNGYGLDRRVNSTTTDKDSSTAKVIRTKKVKTKKVTKEEKDNGKVVRNPEKKDGKVVWTTKDVPVYESTLSTLNKANIAVKATMEAVAKRRGIILDPVWSAYTAEEIMAMYNDGVNIPQDIVDLASTELQENPTVTPDDEENTDGVEDETTEKQPFLNLIPIAKDKIEKCEENNDKLEKEISDLIPEQQKQEKDIAESIKKQRETLDEYQNSVKEYTKLQKKIENGETLTEKEQKRYEDLSKVLGAQKDETDGFELDKAEITKSLNDINILAVLGEKLADETIEVGDELGDYTSKTNYKATRKSLLPQIGGWIPTADYYMAMGKAIGKDAIDIGNDTKEYSTQTQGSVNGIADTLDIKGDLASEEAILNGEVQPSEDNSEEKAEKDKNQDKEQEMPLVVTDKFVVDLIKEGRGINADLAKQIKIAGGQTKVAKGDIVFAGLSDKRVTQIVKAFYDAEEKRQQEIEKTEQENEKKQQEIQDVMDEAQKRAEEEAEEKAKTESLDPNNTDIDAIINGRNDKNNDVQVEYTDEEKKKIDTLNGDIVKNNHKIEGVKQESVQHREAVKKSTAKEKTKIDKSMPIEKDAQKVNQAYQEKDLPEHDERMDFINKAGMILAGIGAGEITVGSRMIVVGHALMSDFLTLQQGIALVAAGSIILTKGTISLGIGLTAMKVSDDESLIEKAEKKTDIAEENINKSITDLSTVDKKIIDVTKAMSAGGEDDSADNPSATEGSGNAENNDNAQGADGSQDTQNGENGAPNGVTAQAGTNAAPANAPAATTTTQSKTIAPTPNETSKTVSNAADSAENNVEKEVDNAPSTDAPSVNKNQAERAIKNDEDKDAENPAAVKKQQKTNATTSTGAKSSSSSKKEAMSTDQAKKDVSKSKEAAKDSSRDSENVKKDTDKTNKELKKETKTLTKKMKRDQKDIIKRTKESQKAAKRQAELVKRYEELNNENEALQAEDAAKIQTAQPTPAANKVQSTAAMTPVAAQQNTPQSNNADKIASNNAEIGSICTEFKVLKKTITTNRKVMVKLQKSTKTTQKKLNKKLKVIDKNEKIAEKKEQEKQKKLAKQLAGVGIAENVFSVTLATGMILSAIPWSALVGQAMVQIGEYGVVACGLTKAAINLANGNLTAALMSIAQAAITVAAAAAGPAAAGAGSVLGAVAGGLSVVSNSAEMVNNVRAVQGKEANGVLSKISTISGVASSVVGAAASLGSLSKTASTLTKIGKIASTVGTAVSSTSQLMTEFGGQSKAANILGMVGGAISMASAVVSIAGTKKDQANAKAADQKEEQKKQEAQATKQEDQKKQETKTELTKEIKEQENKIKQEQAKANETSSEVPEYLAAPTEDSQYDGDKIDYTQFGDYTKQQSASTQNDVLYPDMSMFQTTPSTTITTPDTTKINKSDLFNNITQGIGAATSVASAFLQNGQNGGNQQQKKQAPAAHLDKRTKNIMKKNRKQRANTKKMLESQRKIAALKKLRAAV